MSFCVHTVYCKNSARSMAARHSKHSHALETYYTHITAYTHLLTSAESFFHFDGTEWCLSHWRECAKIIGIKRNPQERGHGNPSGTA